MVPNDLPHDEHPKLTPDQDAAARGANQRGGPDAHRPLPTELPQVDPAFHPSNTRERVDRRLAEDKPRHRTQTLFPYLLVRAVAGDTGGGRPLWPSTPCWESCDIHLLPEAVAKFDFGKTVLKPVAGETYRIFVHAWNLGRFAAYGARVKTWWAEPGFFNGTPDPRYQPHFIGGAYFDWGDRDSPDSHGLVEISPAWTVSMNHDAHECLLVAVECATDPWDGVLDANTHRHVAQRNLDLVAGGASVAPMIELLGGLVSAEDTELVVTTGRVSRASFVGAHERGLSEHVEPPAGWNHGGVVLGQEVQPLLAVRPGRAGARVFDLQRTARLPLPRRLLGAGAPVGGPIGQALPGLIQQALGAADLSAASVCAALGAPHAPGVLRLALTDSGGRTGGYSIVVAP